MGMGKLGSSAAHMLTGFRSMTTNIALACGDEQPWMVGQWVEIRTLVGKSVGAPQTPQDL